jgi:mRNA interferase MazF
VKIKRGYLYLAHLNLRWGTEAGKTRPVVVIQNDLLNEAHHPSTWVVPCTTQLSPPNILRVHLPKGIAGNSKDCDVMADQSRAIDNQRFTKVLGLLPGPIFEEIIEKIKNVGSL